MVYLIVFFLFFDVFIVCTSYLYESFQYDFF